MTKMNRYERNILLEGLGEQGQHLLSQSKVLVIGAGGLGSPVLYYLAAAGVGTLGIVDYDVVDETNLQRQILHHTADIGRLKTASAHEKLKALNPELTVIIHNTYFEAENAARMIAPYDFVIDCCDNYDTKFLINDICIQQKKPYSHGAILAFRGEVMTVLPNTADYRKVFASPPEVETVPSAGEAGVLGAVAGVIGSIQAAEAIKFLTGIGTLLTNRILLFDGRTMSFTTLKINE